MSSKFIYLKNQVKQNPNLVNWPITHWMYTWTWIRYIGTWKLTIFSSKVVNALIFYFNAPGTKNVLYQRRQMLNFLTLSYGALLSQAIHCSGVSKPNITFLIPTWGLSLILSFSHAFLFPSFSLLVLPQPMPHQSSRYLLFFLLDLPQPKLFSSLYGRTQKPKLESAFRLGWIGVLEASFLSRYG